MIFKWFLIALAAAQVNPDDFAEPAQSLCVDFYGARGVEENTISTEYVANGAEAIVFRCWTTGTPADAFPDEAALKIYFYGEGKNFTDLALIDEQLTEQGVRYPVYSWEKTEDGLYAKFEQFLGEYKDFSKFPGGFDDKLARDAAIMRLAELHSADVEDIDKMKHRNPATTWWNTYLVSFHFEQLYGALGEEGMKEFFRKVGWTEEQFMEEILFTERTLQGYYDANPERAVICHNDAHSGNIMRNTDGDLDPDMVILVDYDQAGYGFRMWDIMYFVGSNGVMPTDQIIADALVAYQATQTYDPDLTMETLQQELKHHIPYFTLERLAFTLGAGFIDEEFAEVMKQFYGLAIAPFGRELPTTNPPTDPDDDSSTSALILSSILLLVNLL